MKSDFTNNSGSTNKAGSTNQAASAMQATHPLGKTTVLSDFDDRSVGGRPKWRAAVSGLVLRCALSCGAFCCRTMAPWAVALGLAGGVAVPLCAADSPPRNVLMIVLDDLGWADLSCYSSDYHLSPRIDELANQAMRFQQAYAAAPVCSPTRAALLTGKWPARLDLTIWHEGAVGGGPNDRPLRDALSQPNLPRSEMTLAERLHDRGYFTAHLGKWHLGTAEYYPETQGYDQHIGGTHWGAPATYFAPFRGAFSTNEPELRYVPGLAPHAPNDYLTDRLTDRALEVLRGVGDQPFFMTLWYYSVHSPIEAPAALVDKHRARAPGRHQHDPTYAAMIERVDWNIGRVIDELKASGRWSQTVVVVTSDNGGVDIPVRYTTPTSNHPLRSGKGTLYEGGLRVPLIVFWPERTRAGSVSDVPVITQDLFVTLAAAAGIPPADLGPVDGTSLLPLLADSTAGLSRETLYWHFPHYYSRMTPASAIRHGDWKLIHYYEQDRVELYDLAQDLGESMDRAAAEPVRAAELLRELNVWRTAVGANPPRPAVESAAP